MSTVCMNMVSSFHFLFEDFILLKTGRNLLILVLFAAIEVFENHCLQLLLMICSENLCLSTLLLPQCLIVYALITNKSKSLEILFFTPYDCFLQECHLLFDGSAFYELNGAMYCERHFLAHRGMPCAACGQPISGRCVTAMYKKYHPDHFVCTFCLQPLNRGTFKEQNEKPYCHACFEKLFG